MIYGREEIRDNRTWKQTVSQFQKAQENEHTALVSLTTYLIAHGRTPYETWFEKIDPDEQLCDNKSHQNPDAFLYVDDKKMTLEVKVFLTKKDHELVPFKCSPIFTMLNNPKTFPNGYVFYATSQSWSMMPVSKVRNYNIEVVDAWSNERVKKKAFMIPKTAFTMRPWITPPNFESYS